MEFSAVAPPLRGKARIMSRLPLGSKWGRVVLRFLVRGMPSAKAKGVRLEVRKLAPQLRLYRPEDQRSNAALLWFHGGGYLVGSAVQDDRLCIDICRNLGIVVVSAEYRLAPENPFPAAMEDGLAAWKWLQASAASLGVHPWHVVIGGESAGAGLAASLVQRLHDLGGHRAAAQWLFCPMLDDRTAARRDLDAVEHPVWNNRLNAIAWRSFLGQEPGLASAPAYSVAARRENLAGLPPAWIGTGELELFCAENQDYAERLRRAGVEVEHRIVPGAPHGFEAWAAETEMAKVFVAGAQSWLENLTRQLG